MPGRQRRERGNEGISAILALPIVISLLFGTIEVAWNFRTRGIVVAVAKDIVRGAAADGGTNNPRTNAIGQSWEAEGREQLTARQRCQCTNPASLQVTCASGPASNGTPTGPANVVTNAGNDIVCTIQYPYKPLTAMFSGSGARILGMNQLLGPFTVRYKARSETGQSSS